MEHKSHVFGIGLFKTGTNSLAHALRILGLKSVHHDPSWLTCFFNGKRKADAHCLINMTEFKAVYSTFPGSKFIYTTRALDEWVESCDIHLNKRYARYTTDMPQFAFYRCLAFGSSNPSRQQMKDAYIRHNEEVLNFFGRRSDFLVMDICGGEGWERLCKFLGKPIPEVEFPKKNVRV